jgi:hypothetical protein
MFSSMYELAVHYEIDHQDTERKFACKKNKLCKERFLTKELRSLHMESHGLIPTIGKMKGLYPSLLLLHCRFCDLTSHYPDILRFHELKEHDTKLKYRCSCNGRFFHRDLIKAHLEVHSSEDGPYPCNICPRESNVEFDDPSKLHDHIIAWHNVLIKETMGVGRNVSRKEVSTGTGNTFDEEDSRDFEAEDTM